MHSPENTTELALHLVVIQGAFVIQPYFYRVRELFASKELIQGCIAFIHKVSYVIEFDCEGQAFERDRVRKCSEDALDGRMFEFVKSKGAQMIER